MAGERLLSPIVAGGEEESDGKTGGHPLLCQGRQQHNDDDRHHHQHDHLHQKSMKQWFIKKISIFFYFL